MRVLLLLLISLVPFSRIAAQSSDSSQVDSSAPRQIRLDTFPLNKHIPRRATIRSAIIPGWGQAYNKKYWKIPIVYAAIGVPVATFIYNKNWYNRTRAAARMLSATPIDTANYRNRVDEKLYVFFSRPSALPSLLNYRNEFRRNMDYSVLFVLVAWGLNVVDATVDGHLKEFDVSDDLSFHVKPTLLTGPTIAGISLVFTIGPKPAKNITSLRY